jgi:hypothetical protein
VSDCCRSSSSSMSYSHQRGSSLSAADQAMAGSIHLGAIDTRRQEERQSDIR